jgi:hypothetical protein
MNVMIEAGALLAATPPTIGQKVAHDLLAGCVTKMPMPPYEGQPDLLP